MSKKACYYIVTSSCGSRTCGHRHRFAFMAIRCWKRMCGEAERDGKSQSYRVLRTCEERKQ